MRNLRLPALFALFFATAAEAGTLTIHVGPPALGRGGSNPVSIPPVNPIEYEILYATDGGWETVIGLIPGLFFNRRARTSGGGSYVSFGGGLVIDGNGQGPGVDAAIGYDYGKPIALNLEYRQAVGYDFASSTVLSPYTLRIGASFYF